MINISVAMDGEAMVPDPNIPDGLAEPDRIAVKNFEAAQWQWNGSNITLMRSPQTRTLIEQLAILEAAHQMKILRLVNAAEMMQMVAGADEWPEAWQKHGGSGGRIFFAGSLYRLTYKTGRDYDLVWYGYYDPDCRNGNTTAHARTSCFAPATSSRACRSVRTNRFRTTCRNRESLPRGANDTAACLEKRSRLRAESDESPGLRPGILL